MPEYRFSSMAARLRRSEIRELLKLTRQPDMISFAGGLPDPSLFPYEEIAEAAHLAVRERGNYALQYSPTEGDPFLREQLAEFMKGSGENVEADDILVVSSSQQGIDLISKIFIDPGDPIIVEKPTYVGGLQSFRAFNAEFHGVKLDDFGVRLDKLESIVSRLCDAGRKPKFVYLVPDFQNPSGITLSLERRKQMLELASKYDLLIVEDSPYRELRYEGDLLPSMFMLDTEDRVICMKTFSKIFCPGFRIGWLVGPDAVIDKMVMSKQGTDLCTSAFNSITCAYFIKAGHLNNLVQRAKEIYIRKCRIMLEAMDEFMPKIGGLSWSRPEGGMFLWVRLPEYMDSLEMLKTAIDMKVAYVVGSAFFFDGTGKNTLRLNYSYPSEEQIVEGIKRLGKAISDATIKQSA